MLDAFDGHCLVPVPIERQSGPGSDFIDIDSDPCAFTWTFVTTEIMSTFAD